MKITVKELINDLYNNPVDRPGELTLDIYRAWCAVLNNPDCEAKLPELEDLIAKNIEMDFPNNERASLDRDRKRILIYTKEMIVAYANDAMICLERHPI